MIVRNLLYIFQSENYYAGRFLNYAYSHFRWWKLEQRQKIVWTKKSLSIFILSVLIFILFSVVSILIFKFWSLIILFFLLLFLPVIIVVSYSLLLPLDYFFKKRITEMAKRVLAQTDITVVGITGSYGKTSTKEILAKILEEKFSVVKTPDNINTDIGISQFIINSKELINSGEIFIVEMGAYKMGEIKKICDIVRPDYSILTGINESHLEKFGSLENTIKTKFELAENTDKTAVINLEDKNVKDNYKNYTIKDLIKIENSKIEVEYLKLFSGIKFKYCGREYETKLLAKHNITQILMAIEIAKKFGMEEEGMVNAVRKIKPVKHRIEPIYNQNSKIWVLDDSYNGNLDGIISGLEVLSRANGRKVILTPGLVEQGGKEREVHVYIGKKYAKKADLVLLVKNKVTEFIVEGMKSEKFFNYKIYNNTKEAHSDLANILQSGDTIIFQNDWPDNYF